MDPPLSPDNCPLASTPVTQPFSKPRPGFEWALSSLIFP